MKKLPIGIQDFSELRRGGYLYVDKTEHIHTLATGGKYYFLSRPRRFGESLLVSTMKELFSGNRKLFKGLWIEDKWDWQKTNPILHIPFSSLGYKSLGLERALHEHLDELIEQHNLNVNEEALEKKFREVIEALSLQAGQVVLLIDEYDKPIIDYLGPDIKQAQENQQVLKKFYSVIKDSDAHLRMVFITGVSKFSKVSIFSDLNNLDDLTMTRQAADMLGYTQEELEYYFKEHIAALTEEEQKDPLPKVREWYNGYSWDGRTFVYNPFSILLLFKHQTFSNFWFKTATPTFLIDLVQEKQAYDFDGERVSEVFFDAFQIQRDIPLGTLLFQTGYLTVKQYDMETGLYTLGYPNREVKSSFLEYLLSAFSKFEPGFGKEKILRLQQALQQEDFEELKAIINELLYKVPYQLYDKKEKAFHLVVHVLLDYLGLNVHSEVNTSRGRLDAVVELDDKIYCIEFKVDESAEKALRQILERGYLDKYRSTGKKLIALGINFDTEKREVEEVSSLCEGEEL